MSHVTHATAARLKAAGFPQPAFATGQFWYNQYGEASFVGRRDVLEKTGDETFFCTSVRSGRTEEFTPIHDGSFFAPTATDILRELPARFSLSIRPIEGGVLFLAGEQESFGHVSKNPAEACAAAWLAIHEK